MIYVPVGKYIDFQKRGQCVDDRYTDTVQSTGHLVRVVIELAAGMQFGHNDFERRNLLGFVNSDRNSAAVVDDGDTVVMVDNNLNQVTVTRHGFIDTIVDHFVNEMMKTTIRAAQKAVDPALQMPDDGFLLPIKTSPSAINYYRAGSTDRIEPLLKPGSLRPDIGLEMIDNRRQQIIRSLHADWMQMQEGPQMTATEVLQRQEDRMRLLSPMVGRMQAEYLGPLIQRVFNVLVRRGQIPAPPAILQKESLKIDYTSPVVQAQKMTRMFSVTRLFETIVPLAQVKPEILDNMDVDGTYKWIHELLDAPVDTILPKEVVDGIREGRAKMQAQQQQAETLSKAAPGLKVLQGGAQ